MRNLPGSQRWWEGLGIPIIRGEVTGMLCATVSPANPISSAASHIAFASYKVPKLPFPLKISKWPTLLLGSILLLKFFDHLWGGGRIVLQTRRPHSSSFSGSGFPCPYCPNQSRWPALQGRVITIALYWCLVFSQLHVMNTADAVRYKSLILLQNILFLKEKLIA